MSLYMTWNMMLQLVKKKDIKPEISSKKEELFRKMDDFVDAYIDLSDLMYDVDYDFAAGYPLENHSTI